VQPHVRAALLEFQRAFANRPGGAILDGRDIGTVVCPDADVKFWVDAALAVRARRRWAELRQRQPDLELASVEDDLARRDARDRGREIAPMTMAPDAHLLDTTELTIDAAVEKACRIIEMVLALPKR
jgi:cytidylate kinase